MSKKALAIYSFSVEIKDFFYVVHVTMCNTFKINKKLAKEVSLCSVIK